MIKAPLPLPRYHQIYLVLRERLASGELPPMIHLYRRPLLDEWVETGVDLEALITHVIVHEAGHHFGFSDAEMHTIEEQAG